MKAYSNSLSSLLSLWFVLTVALLSGIPRAQAESQLSFGPLSGDAGTTSEIQINFETSDNIAGLQLDLEIETSEIEILSIPDEGIPTPFEGSLFGNMISPSVFRVVIIPPSGETIPSGVIARIPVRLKADIDSARRPYLVKGLDISNRFGLKAVFSLSSFIDITITGNDNEPFRPGQTVEISAIAVDLANQNPGLSLLINGREVGISGSGKLTVNYLFLEPGRVLVSAISRAQNDSLRLDKNVIVDGEPIRTFNQWQQFWFNEDQLNDPEIVAALADPDEDGKNNAREYIEQTHPLLSDNSQKTQPEALVIEADGESFLGIRLPRRSESSDVDLQFTSSTGLDSDSPTNEVPLIFVESEEFGTVEMVTYRDSVPLRDSENRFIKAVATID